MIIRCHECNQENQLGAIFCRNCGVKLDIDKLKPEVEKKKKATAKNVARNLVALIIFVALAGILAALFAPFGYAPLPALPSDEAMKAATDKYENMLIRVNSGLGSRNFAFTPEEVTGIYEQKFMAKPEGDSAAAGAYNIEKVCCELGSSENSLKITLLSKLFGKIPARFTIEGTPEVVDKKLAFNVKSAKMGHIKMSGAFLTSKVTEKYVPVTDNKTLQKIFEKIESVKINEEGKIALEMVKSDSDDRKAKK